MDAIKLYSVPPGTPNETEGMRYRTEQNRSCGGKVVSGESGGGGGSIGGGDMQ